MRRRLSWLSVAALLAAVGCGNSAKLAPALTMPDAAAHTGRYFPIAVGDTHGPLPGQASADCNGCHYDKAAAAPSATFRVYTCTNCHVLLRSGVFHDDAATVYQAWHEAAGVNQFAGTVASANVPGVAPIDAACRSCHFSGIAVDHDTRLILPHGSGATVAKCQDCHLDQANRKLLGCASCHPHGLPATATAHARVPDFSPTDSALCARCHEDGKVPVSVASHAAVAQGFAVGAGVHAGAAGGACLTCHQQNKATPPRTFVADFKVTTCVGCHVTVGGTAFHDDATSMGTLHGSVPDFTSTVTSMGLSAACLFCHADGNPGAPANHDQLFPRGVGTRHAGIGCAACHGTGLKTDLASLQCASCHNGSDPGLATKHGTVGGVQILTVHTGENTVGPPLALTSPNCLRCHADSQVDRIASHTTGEDGFSRSDHRGAGCTTCHSGSRLDKPYPAANWNATPGCKTCH